MRATGTHFVTMVKEKYVRRERVQRVQEGTCLAGDREKITTDNTREVRQDGRNGQKRPRLATPEEENSRSYGRRRNEDDEDMEEVPSAERNTGGIISRSEPGAPPPRMFKFLQWNIDDLGGRGIELKALIARRCWSSKRPSTPV